jgi:hypothetical protein
LDNRLGKGNRRTDVQRIRGQATDERISTDLDWTKSQSGKKTKTFFVSKWKENKSQSGKKTKTFFVTVKKKSDFFFTVLFPRLIYTVY